MGKNTKNRKFLLICLLILIPLGFYSKFYKGIYEYTINNRISDLLYVTFWIVFIKFVFMQFKNYKIVLAVFLITSILEIMQLWHPPLLQLIRSSFIGKALIGTNFVPEDFLYYILGSAVGYFLLLFNDR